MDKQKLLKDCEYAILEKRFQDVIMIADGILQQDKNDVDALYMKAQALDHSDNFQDALVHYEKLLRLTEDNPGWQANIYISMSETLIELNKLEEADKYLDKALSIKPRLARGWIHKARIAARRVNFENSYEYCERAVSVDPSDPRGWNNRAYALYKLKRYKECIKSAKKALSIKPDYAMAYLHMEKAYLELGKKRASRKCKEKFESIMNQGGPKLEHTKGHKPVI
ncbi:MAG: tetratricopeptide repeat protein [Bacteroidales bacterium]|nr:tetratricopeptide repeat protein [Bacteroidales bacterium]